MAAGGGAVASTISFAGSLTSRSEGAERDALSAVLAERGLDGAEHASVVYGFGGAPTCANAAPSASIVVY